jgi:thymidylate synthase (FAD)
LKVKLFNKTDEMIDIIYTAARTCYNAGSPIDMYENVDEISKEAKLKLIEDCIKRNHLSVLEHAQFTFGIYGISRACSHQLVRHRHCSFSQQSQRYVNLKDKAEFVIPDNLSEKDKVIFAYALKEISECYTALIEDGVKPEDARSILPNACSTNLVMSCNLRELIHICNERLCAKAQSEIRELVQAMKDEVVTQLPFLKPYLQPKCVKLGKCTEAKPCGRVK